MTRQEIVIAGGGMRIGHNRHIKAGTRVATIDFEQMPVTNELGEVVEEKYECNVTMLKDGIALRHMAAQEPEGPPVVVSKAVSPAGTVASSASVEGEHEDE